MVFITLVCRLQAEINKMKKDKRNRAFGTEDCNLALAILHDPEIFYI